MVPYKYEGDVNPFPDTDHNKAFSVTGTLSVVFVVFLELLQDDTKTTMTNNHLNLMG
jgi:hypothetical protein